MGFMYKSRHTCKLPKAQGRKAKRLAGSVWVCNGWGGCGQHYRGSLWNSAAATHLRWHRITGKHARRITEELSNGLEARRVRVS